MPLAVPTSQKLRGFRLAGYSRLAWSIGLPLRIFCDARAFIASANLKRRNLTKSQQAMALAMIHPEPERGKRTDLLGGRTSDVSRERLSLARAVYRASPDVLGPVVLSGAMSLDVALAQVEKRITDANSDTARAARWHVEAPDKGGRGIKRSSETDGVW